MPKGKKSAHVTKGQFLAFQITPKGIKERKEKIVVVTNIEPPETIKELQKLNGRVAALGRFLSEA